LAVQPITQVQAVQAVAQVLAVRLETAALQANHLAQVMQA
jgi:hypothetical protein